MNRQYGLTTTIIQGEILFYLTLKNYSVRDHIYKYPCQIILKMESVKSDQKNQSMEQHLLPNRFTKNRNNTN